MSAPGRLRVAAVVCLGAWLAALWLPAVAVTGGPTLDGAAVLAEGWRALGSGVPSWYANPLFLLACIAALFARPRVAAVLSALACVLALTTFAAPELAAAGGRSVPGVSWRVGFYCWLFAQFGLLICSASAGLAASVRAAQKIVP